MPTVKHKFVSAIPDGADTGLVRPSNWNDDHDLVGVAGSGANSDITSLSGITGGIDTPDYLQLDTAAAASIALGKLRWNAATATASFGIIDGTTEVNIGQQMYAYVTNAETVTITVGQAVYLYQATGNRASVKLAQNTGDATSAKTLGLVTANIAAGATGFVTTQGTLAKLDTSAFAEGDTLYLGATAGSLTATKPVAPNHLVYIGVVERANAGNGQIYVRPQNGYELEELHNVLITSPTTGQGLVYDSSTSLWKNSNAEVIIGGSVDNSPIGNTTPNTGKFTTLEATSTSSLGTASAQYIQAVGDATYPQVKAVGSGTNIPLVLQPKGTGALQAQLTDSTATGGNARGANAVDWQTQRSNATRVASGLNAFVGAGYDSLASGTYSAVIGGYQNAGTGNFSVASGGQGNIASGIYSGIYSGKSNATAGYFNFVGGGFTNSGTANAAVTTQATTSVTSGSTAVTLSGSNASIKVGQYITGTGINADTYVAAISGTSLTLSQNAGSTGTPTLSFFTPHGVVVGGGNNQATGSYSFIGGGGDAGTAANRNVSSGDWSFVGGGRNATASGVGAVVCGGGIFASNPSATYPHTASGGSAFIGGGLTNTSSNNGTFVGAGYSNTANGQWSAVIAGTAGTTRGITCNHVVSAQYGAISTALGVSQTATLVLARQTTDATATVITCDANAASTTNQVILPNNSAYLFKTTVIAGVTGAGNTSGWKLEGVIKRGANAAATSIVGTVTTTLLAQDVGAVTWAVTATADTTNGGLKITVTGQAATTIRWVAKVETTELTY